MSDFQQDTEETPVIFRIARSKSRAEIDGVMAVFPCESYDGFDIDRVSCYAHVGQHGGASISHMMSRWSRPATLAEYADLKQELESAPYGYRLKVYQKKFNFLRERRRVEMRKLRHD